METRNVRMSFFFIGFFVASVAMFNICKKVLLDYRYPLAFSWAHLVMSSLACYMFCAVNNEKPMKTTIFGYAGEINRPILASRTQCSYLLLLTLVFVLQIALGNLSLVNLYPSFFAMMSSFGQVFSMLFAALLGVERYNIWSYVSLVPVIVGTIIIVDGEMHFDWLSFGFLLGVQVLSAIRWVLVVLVFQESGMSPSSMVLYTCAGGAALLIPVMAATEGLVAPWVALAHVSTETQMWFLLACLTAAAYNVFNCSGAKQFNVALWGFLGRLSVMGIPLLSWFMFHNPIDPKQIVGFMLSFAGVLILTQWGRVDAQDGTKEEREPILWSAKRELSHEGWSKRGCSSV